MKKYRKSCLDTFVDFIMFKTLSITKMKCYKIVQNSRKNEVKVVHRVKVFNLFNPKF